MFLRGLQRVRVQKPDAVLSAEACLPTRFFVIGTVREFFCSKEVSYYVSCSRLPGGVRPSAVTIVSLQR